MRIASLIRAGVASSNLKRRSSQQFGDFSQCQPTSFLYKSWERSIHSSFKGFSLFPSWQWEGQQAICGAWFAKDQKSWASSTATAAASTPVEASPKSKVQEPVIYRGPLSDTLRKVKLLSLTSCCLSVVTGPAIVFLTSPHLSVILKGSVAAAVIMLSASTTAALHWFVGPYIHKMTWVPGSKELEVEMVTWLATYEKRMIPVEDIRPPKTNRPFVSFVAKNKFYFVDPDRIRNKELLRMVTFYQKK